ncbi:MAG: glutamine synthetase, partial [Muribaculaceae bacterium]|nr:glutamine synthetase [Muribaculaceae bacterium]
SANVPLLLASLAVATRYVFDMDDTEALQIASDFYVDVDIHKPENAERLAKLPTLPVSCADSADCLDERTDVFVACNVFPEDMLRAIAADLRKFDPAEAVKHPNILVERHFHCG